MQRASSLHHLDRPSQPTRPALHQTLPPTEIAYPGSHGRHDHQCSAFASEGRHRKHRPQPTAGRMIGPASKSGGTSNFREVAARLSQSINRPPQAKFSHCWNCGEFKPQTEFYADRSRSSGLMSRCKVCCDSRPRTRIRRPQARKPPKPCLRCGNPSISARHRYCYVCRDWALMKRGHREYRPRPSGATTSRGYGARIRLTQNVAARVDAGQVFCARCGGWIAPGSLWDLGHDDWDRDECRRILSIVMKPVGWRVVGECSPAAHVSACST